MPWVDHLAVFFVALTTVLLATPVVRWIARRVGAVDEPGDRHIHTRPTPTLGGLALFAALVAAVAAGARLPSYSDIFSSTSEPEAILLAGLLVVALGVVDDVRGVSAPAKLAGQILGSGVLVLFGLTLRFVYVPGTLGVVSLSPDLAALVTIALIVAMVNAVNLVDGLDGLAAGIVLIAAVALYCYAAFAEVSTLGLPTSALLVLPAVAGACVGFLVFNWHPASIFMGDTGAMLLGLLLGAAGTSAIGQTVDPGRGDFAALSIPVLIPALVLAVPFGDTAWAILRRLRSGRAVFSPDKEHLHHRLLELGHSPRRAVLTICWWSGLLAFTAVGVGLLDPRLVAVITGAGVALAVLLAALERAVRWWRARRAVGRSDARQPLPTAAPDDRDFVPSFTKSPAVASQTPPDLRKRVPGEL